MRAWIASVILTCCLIKPALSESVSADDFFCPVQQPSSSSLSKQERLDSLAVLHDCFVGTDELSQNDLLIDIRRSSVLEHHALQDVINIPAHHLSDKTFLREKSVVLMGDAFERVELVVLCEQLKQQGFIKLRVLANAERALSLERLDHSLSLASNAAEITDAGKLLSAYDRGYVRLFYLDADMAARLRAQGLEGELLTLQDNVYEQLQALMKTEGENGLLPVVVMGEGAAILAIRQSFLRQDLPGIYYMNEPEQLISQYLIERSAMLRSRAQSQQHGVCNAG